MGKPRARSLADQEARDKARALGDSRYIGDDCPDHPGGLRQTNNGRCVYCHRDDMNRRRGAAKKYVKPANERRHNPVARPERKLPVAQSQDGWMKPLTKEQLMRGR